MALRQGIVLAIVLSIAGAGAGAWLGLRHAARPAAPTIRTVGTFDAADPQLGRKAYVFCASCHGNDGLGLPGYAPPIARSPWMLGDPRPLVLMVLHGFDASRETGSDYSSQRMLGHAAVLSDVEIAALLTWTRTQWGNAAPAVDAGLVAGLRARFPGRTGPWTLAELRALSAP